MARRPHAPRRLTVDGTDHLWTLRHRHPEGGGCVETLTLRPQPPGRGGPLRIVFADGPGRYVPGGAPLGSGDVGEVRGAGLNLHEPGAVRALLDTARARGWEPDGPAVELDGWGLLAEAAARR
ncbi:hypothetical protein ACIRBX_18410 [Kitasatospora sp. NPDC096147]|uniref:hypothetical protein n=1 Tax=Kitasatospora sp. NPDC096147 TaxID=3364093 RepID=UPI0038159E08